MSDCVFLNIQLFTMCIAYVADRRLAKYVKHQRLYTMFRNVVVWFVFRFVGVACAKKHKNNSLLLSFR